MISFSYVSYMSSLISALKLSKELRSYLLKSDRDNFLASDEKQFQLLPCNDDNATLKSSLSRFIFDHPCKAQSFKYDTTLMANHCLFPKQFLDSLFQSTADVLGITLIINGLKNVLLKIF